VLGEAKLVLDIEGRQPLVQSGSPSNLPKGLRVRHFGIQPTCRFDPLTDLCIKRERSSTHDR
jgi:hypothetical protein